MPQLQRKIINPLLLLPELVPQVLLEPGDQGSLVFGVTIRILDGNPAGYVAVTSKGPDGFKAIEVGCCRGLENLVFGCYDPT